MLKLSKTAVYALQGTSLDIKLPVPLKENEKRRKIELLREDKIG